MRRNSDFSLPLNRNVPLKPSDESHLYDSKVPVVHRKEAAPVNEDAPVPAWLSRLRDRHKRELRQEGPHERNREVRLNIESVGHFEKVTAITGADGKVADFPQVLLDALSHIPTRVGTAYSP